MAPVMGDGNGEEEAMLCGRFKRGRGGGGGEVASQCRRQTTQRRATWRPARPKVASGVQRSKLTKGNWVGGSNARLGRTTD
jgi:hypothetical protein